MASICLNGPWRQTTITMKMLQVRGGKNIRTTGKSKRIWVFQDQIFSKSCYASPQDQALCYEHTLSLCYTAVLNAWDRIHELGKWIKSYISVKQGHYNFSNFLRRLTKAVIEITDPEARSVDIESLAFENASLKYKMVLGTLKDRSAPMDNGSLCLGILDGYHLLNG